MTSLFTGLPVAILVDVLSVTPITIILYRTIPPCIGYLSHATNFITHKQALNLKLQATLYKSIDKHFILLSLVPTNFECLTIIQL